MHTCLYINIYKFLLLSSLFTRKIALMMRHIELAAACSNMDLRCDALQNT